MNPSFALYQPDIPQNLGGILRLSACLAIPVHVIEPCGFVLDDGRIRRAGMDYIAQADWRRHASFAAFQAWRQAQTPSPRLIALETGDFTPYTDFAFEPSDIILLGRESAGLPESALAACDGAVTIPMRAGARSLNVAMAAAMMAGELRRRFPLPQRH